MDWLKRVIVLLIVLALVGVGGAWFMGRGGNDDVSYRTAKVTRGDVLSTIGATGTVEPEEVVDVGAQVAGQIISFGKDVDGKPIDNGSRVKAGMLLAQIDDSLFKSDVDVATAQVAAAKAGVKRAQADLKQAEAKRDQAARDWARAQKLGPSEALAQVTYDAYRATFEAAAAAVSEAEAAITLAETTIAQGQAQLFRAQRNLGYTTINSTIDGEIIERRVNIGQTVVSSLNAPSLFLLAKDLSHMQVWVSVNEADVGKIHPGMPVTFTIDTFGSRTFTGSVVKVRPKAEMTQNVVTYLVEVSTDNSDRTLRPYLSADVKFEVNRREGVLTVPNAALRYSPPQDKIAPEERVAEASAANKAEAAESGGGLAASGVSDKPRRKRDRGASTNPSSHASSRPGNAGGGGNGGEPEWRRGTIWVRAGEFLKPIHVRAGITDGTVTEIRGEGLTEGMEAVTGEIRAEAAATNTNPFGPPQFGKSGRRSGMR
jgi:HlyD family secretion protein